MTPVRWLGRAVRDSGAERVAFSQAAKAALAAVLAWVAASYVFRLPQALLAPWAAVMIVEATVYRSLRTACQQVAVVVVAVLLAVAVDWLLPWQVLGVAVAVFAGLLIGQWRVFGDSGPWIGITALLLITWGTSQEGALLLDRLVETVLGVTIGLTVNGLIFPPVYSGRAQETTQRLAWDMAALLAEMAEAFHRDEPSNRADGWSRRANGAVSLVRQAERAIELSRESSRMNVRRPAFVFRTPTDGWQTVLTNLRNSWPYLAEIVEAARTMTDHVRPFEYPDPTSRKAFATVLDSLANVLRLLGDGHRAGEKNFEAATDTARDAVDRLTDRLENVHTFGNAAGLAGVLLPARHALHELTA
ncbi:MAG TPA: aromatic acid exporter family protein [Actinophytocola sp.]